MDLEPTSLNFIVGPNGAGKTSLLEALYALSTGRSFRGSRSPFINRSSGVVQIYAEVERQGQRHRLGLGRRGKEWEVRVDGERANSLGRLARLLAVLVFHPGLHALVEGSPSVRRRFLDFGVFHVEPTFVDHWRQYSRALKQRNAALRAGDPAEPWEAAMVGAAEPLTIARQQYVDDLYPEFQGALRALSLSMDHLEFSLRVGWTGDLLSRLGAQREADRGSGLTRSGPHRADLTFTDEDGTVSGRLSRGQQKLVALALVLAQAKLLSQRLGGPPILALDDLPSELDAGHVASTMDFLTSLKAQIWITATEMDRLSVENGSVFHVEHGDVRLASST